MHIEQVSCDSLILRYEARIDEKILNEVQRDFFSLQGIPGLLEVVPSYASIWIQYDRREYTMQTVRKKIVSSLKDSSKKREKELSNTFEIPVDYSRGTDLERVAVHSSLSMEEVIALHAAPLYRVYAIGFMVGFAYLGVVDKRIAVPRLATPRSRVPKGAVAIANTQTAVYPKESAGGWNIVGVTEFDGFDKFRIGDHIRFVPVERQTLKKGSDGI